MESIQRSSASSDSSSASLKAAQKQEALSGTGRFIGTKLDQVSTQFTTAEELAQIDFPQAPTSLIKSAATSVEVATKELVARHVAVLAPSPSGSPVDDENDLKGFENIVFKPINQTQRQTADTSKITRQEQPAVQPTSDQRKDPYGILRMPETDIIGHAHLAIPAYPAIPEVSKPAVVTVTSAEPSAPQLLAGDYINATEIAGASEAVATFPTTGTSARQDTQPLGERSKIIAKAQDSISSVIKFKRDYDWDVVLQASRDRQDLVTYPRSETKTKLESISLNIDDLLRSAVYHSPLSLNKLQAIKSELRALADPQTRGATRPPSHISKLYKSAADAIDKTIETLQPDNREGGFIDIRPYLCSADCFLDAAKILSNTPPSPNDDLRRNNATEYFAQQTYRSLVIANAMQSQKMASVLFELGDAIHSPSEDLSITSDLTECLDALTKIPKPAYSTKTTSTPSSSEQALQTSRENCIKLADTLHKIIDAKRNNNQTNLTSLNRELPFDRLIAEEAVQQAKLPKSPPSKEEVAWRRYSSDDMYSYYGKSATAAKQWMDYNDAEADIRNRKIAFLHDAQYNQTEFATLSPALASFDKAIESCRLLKEQYLLRIDTYSQIENDKQSSSLTKDSNAQQGYQVSINKKEQTIEASNQQLVSLQESYQQATIAMTSAVDAVAHLFNGFYDGQIYYLKTLQAREATSK